MWFYGQQTIKVSYHPAKFGGHRYYGSGDMILICHIFSQYHVIKGWCDLVGSHQGRLPSCQVWWLQALWEWRYSGFTLSHDLPRPRDQRVMWLYRQEATQVSYHHAKFDGHRHSGNGDVFNLPRDLDVMTSPAPTWLVSFESNSISYILAKFGAIGLIEMEISILISNLTWTPWKKLNSQSRSTILRDF